MNDNVTQLPPQEGPPDIFGPERQGCDLIIEGRRIPNIHIHDRGDSIEFVLDGRLSYEFPKDWAYLAAHMAANAMAIGAGYAHLGGETKDRHFAAPCMRIDFP